MGVVTFIAPNFLHLIKFGYCHTEPTLCSFVSFHYWDKFNVLSQIIVSSPFTICLFNLSWGLIISTFPEKAFSTSAKQVQKTDEKIILQMGVMVWGEEWGNRLVIGCWNSTVLEAKGLPLKRHVLALLLNKNRPDRINNNGNLNFQNKVKNLETLEYERMSIWSKRTSSSRSERSTACYNMFLHSTPIYPSLE